MNRAHLAVIVASLGALSMTGCERGEPAGPVVFDKDEVARIKRHSPLPAIPSSPTNRVADDPDAARLGQQLFFDVRLSSNAAVACATCHDPETGFSDGRPLSQGIATTARHAQSLWNVAYQRWLFWDGRTDSLWAQAIQPMLDAREMGATPAHLRTTVSSDATLRKGYENLFGSIIDHSDDKLLSNLGKTFEAYQRLLVSTDSPFDRFAASVQAGIANNEHLGEAAQRGLKLFIGRAQCHLCHDGPNFSDGEFHNIGLPGNPDLPRDSGRFEGVRRVKTDRFNGVGAFSDDRGEETNIKLKYLVVKLNNLGEFKTPTLRNVAESPPYMHDGRFATLREVLDFYSELPGEPPVGHREETLVPLRFSEREKNDLEAFLRGLTGEPLDENLVRVP